MAIIHKVIIYGSPIYKCIVCATKAIGDIKRVETHNIEDVHSLLLPIPGAMPVGWASYGRYEYRCPKHVI